MSPTWRPRRKRAIDGRRGRLQGASASGDLGADEFMGQAEGGAKDARNAADEEAGFGPDAAAVAPDAEGGGRRRSRGAR